jgi:hypothetical protein
VGVDDLGCDHELHFCALKTGLLEVRPIFLRDDKGTRGDVLCSVR